MPVVVFNQENEDQYVNTKHESFGSSIFVALRQTMENESGVLSA